MGERAKECNFSGKCRDRTVAEAQEYPREQKRAGQGYAKMMQDKAGSGWSQGSQSVPGEVLKATGGPQPPLREKVTWPIFPF